MRTVFHVVCPVGYLRKVSDDAQVPVPDLIFSQVGYWNEDEKFVSTAAYIPGSNDTYGLQNRTYIVTTIMVCLLYIFTWFANFNVYGIEYSIIHKFGAK